MTIVKPLVFSIFVCVMLILLPATNQTFGKPPEFGDVVTCACPGQDSFQWGNMYRIGNCSYMCSFAHHDSTGQCEVYNDLPCGTCWPSGCGSGCWYGVFDAVHSCQGGDLAICCKESNAT